MNNLYTIHPKKSDLILLYEVWTRTAKLSGEERTLSIVSNGSTLHQGVRECWYLLGIVMRRTPTL
jgi:hypothetical protein